MSRPIQPQTKTVIFVGGTSYSGSTLIDMILANDPAGISCGEVYAVFYPFRRHHLRLKELGERIDWRAMRESGPQNLYLNLFKQFPECHFVVDSSKSPLWISERSKELDALGIRTVNVLIWKSPDEFRASRRKRGRERNWEREWINYHRYYFTLVRDWRSVRYRDLVTKRETLPQLCSFVGIPYFPGKEEYWNSEQHSVFGNDTARIHLFEQSTAQFEKLKNVIASDLEQIEVSPHRKIAYTPLDGIAEGHGDGVIQEITEALERFDIEMEPATRERLGGTDELRVGRLYRAYQVARMKSRLGWVLDAIGR
jgi:hypothetical protein